MEDMKCRVTAPWREEGNPLVWLDDSVDRGNCHDTTHLNSGLKVLIILLQLLVKLIHKVGQSWTADET